MTAKRLTITKPLNGQCTSKSFTATFTYDNEGKNTSITYPVSSNFTINNGFDTMSRLSGVTGVESVWPTVNCGGAPWNGSTTWASSAAYNPASQLTSANFLSATNPSCYAVNGSLATETHTYNNLNQLTEIDATGMNLPNNVLAKYVFPTTGNNGQITQAFDGRLNYTSTYSYDALKRLTSAQNPSWSQTFGYDGFGNMITKSAPPGSSEPAMPGADPTTNRLLGVSYDPNGDALAAGAFALAYDMENRLLTATINGSAAATYAYDTANRRIEEISWNADMIFFYGPDGRLLTSFNAAAGLPPNPVHRIYFGSKLIGTTTGIEGGELPVMADRLGTAQAGYAYGTDISGVSFKGSNDLDFATYRKDSVTGLEYANQRWYSAGFGRFTTVDPYAGSANISNPGTLNRYGYVNGDPINQSDPTGLIECGQIQVAGGMTVGDYLNDTSSDIGKLTRFVWAEGGTLKQNNGSEDALSLSQGLIGQAIINRLSVANGATAVMGADSSIYWGGGIYKDINTGRRRRRIILAQPASILGYGSLGTTLSQEIVRAAAGTSEVDASGNLNDSSGIDFTLSQDQGDITKPGNGKGFWFKVGARRRRVLARGEREAIRPRHVHTFGA